MLVCRTLKLGNKNCSLQPLIGCPFGSLFQAENGDRGLYLSRVLPTTEGSFFYLSFYFIRLVTNVALLISNYIYELFENVFSVEFPEPNNVTLSQFHKLA